jgi:hypothetical protein
VRDGAEPLDTIPQSPGLSWQVTRVGEDDDEHVVVVERGGERLFVVNADEEREDRRSRSTDARESSLITMALLPDDVDLVTRPRTTDPAADVDPLYATLQTAGRTGSAASNVRSESLFSILLPTLDGEEEPVHSSSRTGSTSSTRPETAVHVKRKPLVSGSLNIDKALPALPADLMPSPLFSSTAAILRAMGEPDSDSDDPYSASAGAPYAADDEDATPMPRPLPRLTSTPPPPTDRADFDWADVMLSRFSVASQDAPAPAGERPRHEPGHYAESSGAEDTDGASLAGWSSNAADDDEDAASASTFSVAPSGAASASTSPRAVGPGAVDAGFSKIGGSLPVLGGPVRKPSSRQLRALAPTMGGGKGKGKEGAGLVTARQAVAQMQQLLDEFEYLGAALI